MRIHKSTRCVDGRGRGRLSITTQLLTQPIPAATTTSKPQRVDITCNQEPTSKRKLIQITPQWRRPSSLALKPSSPGFTASSGAPSTRAATTSSFPPRRHRHHHHPATPPPHTTTATVATYKASKTGCRRRRLEDSCRKAFLGTSGPTCLHLWSTQTSCLPTRRSRSRWHVWQRPEHPTHPSQIEIGTGCGTSSRGRVQTITRPGHIMSRVRGGWILSSRDTDLGKGRHERD